MPFIPPGEAGLLLTKILKNQPFLGYRGPKEQTKRKLVTDVQRVGDLYYNTGDVLSLDSEGFFYFQDRLGDTFRLGMGGLGYGAPGVSSLSRDGCGFSSQGQNIHSWGWGLSGMVASFSEGSRFLS